ncbi:MAG TPA: patatin family protein [Anaerovoracaceae bacterium]|nr:patatin family protein [Anaerovoracaceae bacterium]
MFYEGNLILEGGAKRGVFTSGLLDYFMEQNLEISDVISVSAGSFNAINYISNQHKRSKVCVMSEYKKDNCISFKDFLTKKQLIDMDKTFDTFSNERYPFDYEAFFKSNMKAEIVATNCLTGKAEYLEPKTNEEIMLFCRASCSMPMLVNMVNINGKPYLDGGPSAAIPLEYVLSKKKKKNVFILTRPLGFRKEMPSIASLKLQHKIYEKYPELLFTLKTTNKRYNLTLDLLEKLERHGDILVIRPSIKPISHFERNHDKITEFYNHGYETAKESFEELIEFLNK